MARIILWVPAECESITAFLLISCGAENFTHVSTLVLSTLQTHFGKDIIYEKSEQETPDNLSDVTHFWKMNPSPIGRLPISRNEHPFCPEYKTMEHLLRKAREHDGEYCVESSLNHVEMNEDLQQLKQWR